MDEDELSEDFGKELDSEHGEESEESDAPFMSNEDEEDDDEEKQMKDFGLHPIDEEEEFGM